MSWIANAALTKSGKTLYSGDSDVITWSCQYAGCITLETGMSVADSLAWQIHLPDTTADNTSLLKQANVQYQSGTGGSIVEKPAETQTSIRLACRRAPNCRSGGHEFEFPIWWNSVHWLTWKDSWGQVFLHCLAPRILCAACCAIVLRIYEWKNYP